MSVVSDSEMRSMADRIKLGNLSDEDVGSQLAVVFGSHNKLTAEGPFLDLLAEFKTELWQHSELLVIGYSFRDPHINYIIGRWLDADRKRQIHVVDPASEEDCLFRKSMGANRMQSQCYYHRMKASEAIKQWFTKPLPSRKRRKHDVRS